ncbi:MAG: PP2C family protein-serine/threonine phosphatase [Rhodoferax sp.]
MKLSHATLSTPGGRKVNEDAANNLLLSEAQGCWVVADGLGGHGGGDVASSVAVNSIINAYQAKPEFSGEQLGQMLVLAHQAILQSQQNNDRLSAMRSTVVLLVVHDARAWWAHVGDSRLYHFANGRIVWQTKDHSVPQVMVDAGDISANAIRHHEDRNRLTRCLGNSGKLRTTVSENAVAVTAGDAFLLCTDGFWEFVTEADMQATLAKSATPADWLTAMKHILLGCAPTSHDNYTATAIFVQAQP